MTDSGQDAAALADPQIQDSTESDESPTATEISFDEHFYPARPRALGPRARLNHLSEAPPPFAADARNHAYVEWLENMSMLGDANNVARQLSGQAGMWLNPYAYPNPRSAVDRASVWFTAYPLSLISAPGQSYLAALGEEGLWTAFEQIGVEAVHIGPVKRAGGISGWDYTASVDGHFDRISMALDPLFGTEKDFRVMCAEALAHDGVIIDDIVPGHTGKGADFRLAEMNHKDYPGIYHMVDIPEEDWHLLPDVPPGQDSVNIDQATEKALQETGYIIGQMQRVIFYEPGVKETNWSATRAVRDTTGKFRRWVYLHYFKSGQPSINWLDPTCSGMRLVLGDAMHSLVDLGSAGLRLDANGFLGVEKSAEEQPAWSEGHPLSQAANQLIGSMVRKVGGFTFQELNLTMDDIKATSKDGPDLSYDFVTRPAYHHAFVTGDTGFLRLTLREAMKIGIDQASLVHALQNHDEMTYELVHFATKHKDETYTLGGREFLGSDLAEHIRQTLRDKITEPAASYNLVFTQNGIACTTASIIAATQGLADPAAATDEQVEQIRRGHLLLAMFNALQPGVFALSGWDLAGNVTLDPAQVQSLIREGDTRWIHRGAHDLMGANPAATASTSGMPKARSLYGSLPDQLADPASFARQLGRVLAVRKQLGIATGALLEVIEAADPEVLAMVNWTASGLIQLTVLNFSGTDLVAEIASDHLEPGCAVVDGLDESYRAVVDADRHLSVPLAAYQGRALVVEPAAAPSESAPVSG
ncbi:maltose alpha-D-glucosyltransferase [Nakamurella multipartita]|uniref:Trehalose synthase n=1 Tax=Nakamurella multipartita (strain ATCC 700099 / DSM 44233 / CIP 104796 / JCM 9543 / NBRC 105858 / Y-104) TaxID=479431 RepID=C8X6C1_NAKMY|nr:maltose alpha-D-glucosyltransferase [Nakamurella multipartita]ACV78776.1 trehalose synthase [Nakamurella multipartita DSM 44233]